MSATLAAGTQLCSLCEEPPFGNHGTEELNEKMKNTSEKRKAIYAAKLIPMVLVFSYYDFRIFFFWKDTTNQI